MAGLNSMPENPLFNMGLGLMSAARPFGNVGESLMQANQQTLQNRAARQKYQLDNIGLQQKSLQLPLAQAMINSMSGQQPQGLMAPPQQPMSPPSIGAIPGMQPQMPPMSAGQGPMAPPPQAPPSAPAWMTPPSQASIDQTPIAGVDPRLLRAYSMMQGKDPVEADKSIQGQQLALAQRQVGPTIARLEDLVKSDAPTRVVSANADLKAAWASMAPSLGLDPVKDFNDANVRQAFGHVGNNLRASVGQASQEAPVQMQNFQTADGREGQIDPITGKQTFSPLNTQVMTADQTQNMQIAQQKLALEKQKQAVELSRSGIPNGYEPAPTADNPKAIRPIEGGPSDPLAVGGGMGNRNEVMFQRVANAGNSAAESLKNIGDLPITASTGMFGGYQPPTSLFGSTKGILTQKLNAQDVQDYKVMMAGVSRNLATLETSGLSPGGSLTHSMDALTIGEGDTQMTKMRKLAEARQIIETNLGPQLSNPKIPAPQKQMIQDILSKTATAVPFTNADITRLQQSKDPKATIMDVAKKAGLPTGTKASVPLSNAKGWILHTDKNGNQAYVSGDGKKFEAVQGG